MFHNRITLLALLSLAILATSCGDNWGRHRHSSPDGRKNNDKKEEEAKSEDKLDVNDRTFVSTSVEEKETPVAEPTTGVGHAVGAAQLVDAGMRHAWQYKPQVRRFGDRLRSFVQERRARRQALIAKAGGFFERAGYRFKMLRQKLRSGQGLLANRSGNRPRPIIQALANRGTPVLDALRSRRNQGGGLIQRVRSTCNVRQRAPIFRGGGRGGLFSAADVNKMNINLDAELSEFPDAQLETIGRMADATAKIASTFADQGVSLNIASSTGADGEVQFSESQAEALENLASNKEAAVEYFVANNIHEVNIQTDCADDLCEPTLNDIGDEGCSQMSLNLTPGTPLDSNVLFENLQEHTLDFPQKV